jgi:restriction system protein
MSVPDYQSFMLPLLELAGDGEIHSIVTDREIIASKYFNLSGKDRTELLPSGRQTKYHNRIAWARTYLSRAGLLEVTSRGKYKITNRGKAVLKEKPRELNTEYLMRYSEFQAFKSNNQELSKSDDSDRIQTPEEILESGYLELRNQLAQEILEKIKKCHPSFFEQLIVDLFVKMGYGGSRKDAGEAVGQSGDGGIDGIIKEDKLGLDAIYIQAKRWENTIGRPILQAFAGSLEGHRAKKGIFVTTSDFSKEAKEYVKHIEKRIVLISGDRLTQLMIDYGIGVTEEAVYVIKKIDNDYFESGEI